MARNLNRLFAKLKRGWHLHRNTGGRLWRASQVRPPFPLACAGKINRVAAPPTPGSSAVYVEILGDDLYRKALWLERLNERPRIVDIGANYGLFSSWLKLLRPDATVTAIEPNPEALVCLRENAATFGFQVVAKAVSESTEPARLSIGSDSTIARLLAPDESLDGVEVQTITPQGIAALGRPRINLLKCDCEGGEKWLLRNEELLSVTETVVMEYHTDQVEREWVRERLVDAGFAILDDRPSAVSGHLVAAR